RIGGVSPRTTASVSPVSWQDYVRSHLQGRTQAAIAAQVDVSAGAVSRWLNGTQGVDAGRAIRFARAMGDEPLTALIAAGYLTPQEAGQKPAAPPVLSALTDEQLLDEVRGRMRRGEGSGAEQPAPIARGSIATTGRAPGPSEVTEGSRAGQ